MKDNLKPTVSVVMAVYNDALFVAEAIDSILTQSFTDFEFIIINDGSTDGTAEVIDGFQDKRIRRLNNEKNLGLMHSLNRGLAIAEGNYIARMDADDKSYPDRLQKQVDFLQSHPDVTLIGSWFYLNDISKDTRTLVQFPSEPDELHQVMLYRNSICHPSVMFRRAEVNKLGGYRTEWESLYGCGGGEDWDLWLRILDSGALANLAEPLVEYRLGSSNLTSARRAEQLKASRLALQDALRRWQEIGAILSVPHASLARHHYFVALLYFIENDLPGTLVELEKALDARADFHQDADYIVNEVVQFAIEEANSSEGVLGSDRGLLFINTFFDNIRVGANSLSFLRRRAIGLFLTAAAFEAYSHQNFSRARAGFIRAIRTNPTILKNRGLIAALVKSVFMRGHSTSGPSLL